MISELLFKILLISADDVIMHFRDVEDKESLSNLGTFISSINISISGLALLISATIFFTVSNSL